MKLNLKVYDYIIVIQVILLVCLFFIPQKYNLYDYLKGKRLQSYNEKHKEILIKCLYCNGTGERDEDINAIMRDAKMALWLNSHLMSEKCKDCDSKNEKYCEKVDQQYKVFVDEYNNLGPKIEKTSCSECMGMGQFSSFDMTKQKYLTQEEYEEREQNK